MVSLPAGRFFWRIKGGADDSWTEAAAGTTISPVDGTEIEVKTVAPSKSSFKIADTNVVSSAIANVAVAYGDSITKNISSSFTGTNLVYSIASGPNYLSINPVTGVITGTAPSQIRRDTVVVKASNSSGSATSKFNMDVDIILISSLNPVIWYDAQDIDALTIDTSLASNASTLSVSSLINKANPGTYDAVQSSGTLKLRLGADAMNYHYSVFNNGSGYHTTGYMPDGSAKSIAIPLKMCPTLGTVRCMFGCSDSTTAHRFYIEIGTDGKVIVGLGNAAYTSAGVVVLGGQQSLAILTMNGTTFTLEIDGVEIFTNQAYTFSGSSTVDMRFHGRTNGTTPSNFFGSTGNTGSIGEFILSERVWTSDEKTKVRSQLTHKWSNRLKIKVILAISQSNQCGIVLDQADYATAANEKPDKRILMMNRVSGAYNPATTYDSDVVPCMEPLKHWSVTNRAMGPCMAMAKTILAGTSDRDVRILIVPASYYSTGFSNADPLINWQIGNRLATDAVTRANVAMSKTPASIEFYGIDIQGFEQDVGAYTQSAFTALFDGLINHFKANITGASNCRIVIGQMVPQKDGGTVTASQMDAPNRFPRCAFVPSTGLSAIEAAGSELHYATPSYRIIGQRKGAAFLSL